MTDKNLMCFYSNSLQERNEKIFLMTKLFIRICALCEVSVVGLQKVGIPCHNKHFPSLRNLITYQELFYIYHGTYGGYVK